MVLSIVLLLDEVTDTSVRYVEQTGGKPPVIGTVVIERWASRWQGPLEMGVTFEYDKEARSTGEGMRAHVSERAAASRASLTTGSKVTIIKNEMAGVNYPPEWLAQYLGNTGVVLWITHDGAMVQLAGGATWFPYAELRLED